jgi:hypothetical protein
MNAKKSLVARPPSTENFFFFKFGGSATKLLPFPTRSQLVFPSGFFQP